MAINGRWGGCGDECHAHELKCWPEFFAAVKNWDKMFEIRHNDRNFRVGDIVWLREWSQVRSDYTGDSLYRRISYITDFPSGLRDGYVCMGLVGVVPETAPACNAQAPAGSDARLSRDQGRSGK